MYELNIYDIGLLALRQAMKAGADEVEVFIAKQKVVATEIQNNRMTKASSSIDGGIGIRVVVDGKLGFASANQLSPSILYELAEKAVSIAKTSKRDKKWPGFPSPQDFTVPKGIFSHELANIKPSDIVEKTKKLLELATQDKRIIVVTGGAEVSKADIAILNTNGLANVQHLTYAITYLEVVANESGDVTPAIFSFEWSRTTFPSIEKIARETVEKALKSLHPAKIESGKYPIILLPSALEMLFNYTFFRAISGDSVVRGRSPYIGKIGEQIASDALTVEDNGLLKHGLFTSIFDGEGVPRKKTLIIEKGVLRNFLFDHYWAKQYGTESTGNAYREDYGSRPSISPSNVIIHPGTASLEEMINETKKGLLVEGFQGAHSSNPETGEYSVVATPAWLIEEGELKPVRGVMIAGNIYEELKRIDMIGKEQEKWIHIISPPLRISELRVVSKE